MKKFLLASLFLLSALPIARAQTNVWTDTFSLVVILEARPSVSTNNLTMNALVGETVTADLVLTNAGNIDVNFTIGDVISLNSAAADYLTTTQSAVRVSFVPPQHDSETVFTNWNGNSTALMNLGFSTHIGGTGYTNFTVNLDGTIKLGSLTIGTATSAFDPASVRYKKEPNRLVVAWGVDPNSTTFDYGDRQIWIHKNGTYQFLFKNNNVSAAVQDSILRAPQMISIDPEAGKLSKGGSLPLTFTFNAADQTVGTKTFSTTVFWSNKDTTDLTINVVVGSLTQQLNLPPAPTFYGQAGLITSTNITVTNSGNSALSYAISYPAGTYTAQQVDYANGWITGGTAVPTANLGAASYNLDFPFTFFGKVYTSLIINEDGSITLDSTHSIKVLYDDLQADGDTIVTFRNDLSKTRAVVTWNNLSRLGSSENYTFQAVLNRDKTIRCNYRQLASDWTNGVINITAGTTPVAGSLFNDDTIILTTNKEVYVSGTTNVTIGQSTWTENVYSTNITVTTTYTNTVSSQAIQFTPSARQIISASPATGTIGAGKTAVIKLTGDARSLDDGGANNIPTSTTLSFVYSGITPSLVVTFIATNSADTAYPSLAPAELASMWGTPSVPNIWIEQDGLGSARSIFWPAPEDDISRVYQVWYTASLTEPFEPIEESITTNGFQFVDDEPERINNAQAFYKVTVE